MKVIHFAGPAEFRVWLVKHHATAAELWVGFYRKDSGKGGLTYPEALDEALCFGWIDGIRKKTAPESYTNRFTPRKARSIWSKVNVGHVTRLTSAGRMHPAGLTAFGARTAAKTGVYSFERKQPAKLPLEFDKKFRAAKRAWAFLRLPASGVSPDRVPLCHQRQAGCHAPPPPKAPHRRLGGRQAARGFGLETAALPLSGKHREVARAFHFLAKRNVLTGFRSAPCARPSGKGAHKALLNARN